MLSRQESFAFNLLVTNGSHEEEHNVLKFAKRKLHSKFERGKKNLIILSDKGCSIFTVSVKTTLGPLLKNHINTLPWILRYFFCKGFLS